MATTHSPGFFLSLREGATLARDEGRLRLQFGPRVIEFRQPARGTALALELLARQGDDEDHLTEIVLEADGPAALAAFYYNLHRLSQAGLLLRSVRLAGQSLATLEPLSPYFNFDPAPPDPRLQYLLSRFAFVRAEGGELLLESPLAHARILLHSQHTLALIHALAQPRSITELIARFDPLPAETIKSLLHLLANMQALTDARDDGVAREAAIPALRTWEFHDLLFHSRSRIGRHNNPVGSAYRFVGQLDPPPALKPPPAGNAINLYRPDIERLKQTDPPFARVQDARSSIRAYHQAPITDRQLGEFLYRAGRVMERREIERPTPRGPIRMEFARRPYPGSGALHELELYALVNACANVPAGLYYYDPENHQLINLEARREQIEALASGAGGGAGLRKEEVQVVIFIAARFQRLAWKYASMAYAVLLKDVGVLYETMYLVATAMGLAPCAVGCGNADLFARAIKSDYYEETSVGEFLLGSKADG